MVLDVGARCHTSEPPLVGLEIVIKLQALAFSGRRKCLYELMRLLNDICMEWKRHWGTKRERQEFS